MGPDPFSDPERKIYQMEAMAWSFRRRSSFVTSNPPMTLVEAAWKRFLTPFLACVL